MQDLLYDRDRNVKVYLDGTPVVNSTIQSQYSKFLNFKNRFTAVVNGDKYDIDFKYADQILTKLNNVPVGTQPRYLNFSSDFTDVEDIPNNNYNIGLKFPYQIIPRIDNVAIPSQPRLLDFKTDFVGTQNITNNTTEITLKYPNKILAQKAGVAVNTVPRKLNVLTTTGLNLTENVANDSVDLDLTQIISDNPRISGKYVGLFPGTTSSLNSSGGFRSGYGLFNSWVAFNVMNPAMDATEGAYLDWVTGGTTANFVSYDSDDAIFAAFMRKQNPFIEMKIRIPDLSANRCFYGFTNGTLPSNEFTFLEDLIGFGIRFDTGQDTNWQILSNTGAATIPAPVDTGVAVTANTLYTFQIFADNAGSRFGVSIVTGPQSSTAFSLGTPIYKTTNIPGPTDPLGFSAKYTTQTGDARHMHMFYTYGECNFK